MQLRGYFVCAFLFFFLIKSKHDLHPYNLQLTTYIKEMCA